MKLLLQQKWSGRPVLTNEKRSKTGRLFASFRLCPRKSVEGAVQRSLIQSMGLFTWSEGPRSSGVGFFCFHALGDTKQKKLTPLDRGPPLHVNRVYLFRGRVKIGLALKLGLSSAGILIYQEKQ